MDTVRNSYIINALVKANKHVLLVGNTGTGTLFYFIIIISPNQFIGKTSTVQGILTNPPEGFSSLTINFSAQTS